MGPCKHVLDGVKVGRIHSPWKHVSEGVKVGRIHSRCEGWQDGDVALRQNYLTTYYCYSVH